MVVAELFVGPSRWLTGMSGALMTPLLVLLFGVHPLAAVSSAIVAAAVMNPSAARYIALELWQRLIESWFYGSGSGPSSARSSGLCLLIGFDAGATLQPLINTRCGVALFLVDAGLLLQPWIQGRLGRQPDPEGIANAGVVNTSRIKTRRFANLLPSLKNTSTPSGDLLDESLVMYTSENGDGDSHSRYGIPVMLGGGVGRNHRRAARVDRQLLRRRARGVRRSRRAANCRAVEASLSSRRRCCRGKCRTCACWRPRC